MSRSNFKKRKAKSLYRADGIAKDQETIIRLRPQIEAYVREDLQINFSSTSMRWDMNKDTTFSFYIDFYA